MYALFDFKILIHFFLLAKEFPDFYKILLKSGQWSPAAFQNSSL
jgi:hypothetical protein